MTDHRPSRSSLGGAASATTRVSGRGETRRASATMPSRAFTVLLALMTGLACPSPKLCRAWEEGDRGASADDDVAASFYGLGLNALEEEFLSPPPPSPSPVSYTHLTLPTILLV